MSGKKNKTVQVKRGIRTQAPLGAFRTSKTLEQKRADEYADIEAMENRERKELDAEKDNWQNNSKDAQAYREYMDEQVEKAAWKKDKNIIFIFSGLFFFLLAVISFLANLATFNIFYVVLFCISGTLSILCLNALKLRAVKTPFPARGKGDK